jgi:hypothetical protein
MIPNLITYREKSFPHNTIPNASYKFFEVYYTPDDTNGYIIAVEGTSECDELKVHQCR